LVLSLAFKAAALPDRSVKSQKTAPCYYEDLETAKREVVENVTLAGKTEGSLTRRAGRS